MKCQALFCLEKNKSEFVVTGTLKIEHYILQNIGTHLFLSIYLEFEQVYEQEDVSKLSQGNGKHCRP